MSTTQALLAGRARPVLCAIALLACALLAAAATAAPRAAYAQAAGATLTLDQLRNATYPSTFTSSGTAPLADGAYSEPAAPGSASLVQVQFVNAATAPGFAAVVLATSAGGSGTFYTLHLVTLQNGAPFAGAGLQLGDRIQLHSIAIENNQVVIDMTTHGPTDPMCCPTQGETRVYGFGAAGFGLLSTTPAGAGTAAPPPAATGSAGITQDGGTALALQLALFALAALGTVGARRIVSNDRS